MTNSKTLRQNLLLLWRELLPLSLSDIVMAFSDPLITTTLARLPHAQLNIGAFGVAKSSAVVFESPIIMILHASNVLAPHKGSRRSLWQFTLLLSGCLSVGLFLISLPWVFSHISEVILGVSGELAARTNRILSIVILWPFVIGWRRFFQGLLIRAGYTLQVGRASLGRLVIVVVALLVGFHLKWPGDLIAGVALMGGLLAESILVTHLALRNKVSQKIEVEQKEDQPRTLLGIWKFYWPLAISSLAVWVGRALLISLVARSIDGPIALAAWTAGWGMVLVVGNATRMIQQIVIRWRSRIKDAELLIFALSVGSFCTLILATIGLTPIGNPVLQLFLGSNSDLITNVIPVLTICSMVPMGIAFQNALQGLLISEGRTLEVNLATWFGFFSVLISASILVFLGKPGATAASVSMLFANLVEVLFLLWSIRSLLLGAIGTKGGWQSKKILTFTKQLSAKGGPS